MNCFILFCLGGIRAFKGKDITLPIFSRKNDCHTLSLTQTNLDDTNYSSMVNVLFMCLRVPQVASILLIGSLKYVSDELHLILHLTFAVRDYLLV